MTDLIPVPSWDKVRQIETTDLVLGGPGGVANTQAQALLNNFANLRAGVPVKFDPEFSEAIGGYPEGSNLLLDDNVTEVVSTVAGNQNNPNTDMTGWKKKEIDASQVLDASGLNQQEINNVTAINVDSVADLTALPTWDGRAVFVGATLYKYINDEWTLVNSNYENFANLKTGAENAVYNYTLLQSLGADGKTLILPAGEFYVSQAVDLKLGQVVHGRGAFRGTGSSLIYTKLINTAEGGSVFKCAVSSAGSGRCPSLYDTILQADFPVMFNDLTGLTVSNSLAKLILMQGEIKRNVFIAQNPSVAGVGLYLGMVFDSTITQNIFHNFDVELALIASDLNNVHDNRFTSSKSYSILELSAGSFGSQSRIEHNDMVGTTGTFIKTTSNHATVLDNYLEQTAAGVKVFIDASFALMPTYSWMPTNTNIAGTNYRFTTLIDENRLDGQTFATDCVYKYQAVGQTQGYIRDRGTTGTANTKTLRIVNADDTNALGVPVRYSATATASFEFIGANFGQWDGYKTNRAPSRLINSRNFAMSSASLTANNAFSNIRLGSTSVFFLSGTGGAYVSTQLDSGLFPESTEQVLLRVTARQVKSDSANANETLYASIARINGSSLGTQVGRATNALSSDFQTFEHRGILGTTDASNGIGCALVRSSNTSDPIEIKSIEFLTDYLKTYVATSLAIKYGTIATRGANGIIDAYFNDGTNTSHATFSFINGKIVKIAETATSSASVTLTATYSSNVVTITNTGSSTSTSNAISIFYRSL